MMVKSHHEQWRANQRIQQLRDSTVDNFSKVLQSVGAQGGSSFGDAALPAVRGSVKEWSASA
jgi:hypothetical protein